MEICNECGVEFGDREWHYGWCSKHEQAQKTLPPVTPFDCRPGLPNDPAERKGLQFWTFLTEYFLDAWMSVVAVARIGNQQHNPGERMYWNRDKSTDQMNAAMNHLLDYACGAKFDVDGSRHLSKAIWRLMAQDQLDQEKERGFTRVPWPPVKS